VLDRVRSEGLSILLVEHGVSFVMGLVDRIIVVDVGTRIAEGPPDAIRDNPLVQEAYLGGILDMEPAA
jgi:branched-chain amino acid transport system permease protein